MRLPCCHDHRLNLDDRHLGDLRLDRRHLELLRHQVRLGVDHQSRHRRLDVGHRMMGDLRLDRRDRRDEVRLDVGHQCLVRLGVDRLDEVHLERHLDEARDHPEARTDCCLVEVRQDVVLKRMDCCPDVDRQDVDLALVGVGLQEALRLKLLVLAQHRQRQQPAGLAR